MDPQDILAEVAKWTPVVVLIASVINAFTTHYSKHKSWAKALLALAERLSFLTSKDVSELTKYPLTDAKPPTDLDKKVREVLGK